MKKTRLQKGGMRKKYVRKCSVCSENFVSFRKTHSCERKKAGGQAREGGWK